MSLTQRLASVSALHPWRVLAGWGLALVASIGAIAALLGSALTTDANITTRPDSVRADELISDSFSQRNQIDEGVVIHSADLTAEEQAFREFVAGVRSSVEDTGATRIVSDPYSAEAGPAISQGRARGCDDVDARG